MTILYFEKFIHGLKFLMMLEADNFNLSEESKTGWIYTKPCFFLKNSV